MEHGVVVPSVFVVRTAAWCAQHDGTFNYWSKAVHHPPPSEPFTGHNSLWKVWPSPLPKIHLSILFTAFLRLGKKKVGSGLSGWYLRVEQTIVGKRRGLCDIMKDWYGQAKEDRFAIIDGWLTEFLSNIGPWTLKLASRQQHLNGTSCQRGRHGTYLIQIGGSIKTLARSWSGKSIGRDEETSVNLVNLTVWIKKQKGEAGEGDLDLSSMKTLYCQCFWVAAQLN